MCIFTYGAMPLSPERKSPAILPAILSMILTSGVYAQAPDPDAYQWVWDIAAVQRFDDLR